MNEEKVLTPEQRETIARGMEKCKSFGVKGPSDFMNMSIGTAISYMTGMRRFGDSRGDGSDYKTFQYYQGMDLNDMDTYFRNKLADKGMFDIGSSAEPYHASWITKHFDIPNYYMVDPFLEEDNVRKELERRLERGDCDEYKKIIPKRADGSTFLFEYVRPASGNVMTNGLDYAVIHCDDYAELLVQGIERVVPPGGIWISHGSYELERIARERGNFKEKSVSGGLFVFEK